MQPSLPVVLQRSDYKALAINQLRAVQDSGFEIQDFVHTTRHFWLPLQRRPKPEWWGGLGRGLKAKMSSSVDFVLSLWTLAVLRTALPLVLHPAQRLQSVSDQPAGGGPGFWIQAEKPIQLTLKL